MACNRLWHKVAYAWQPGSPRSVSWEHDRGSKVCEFNHARVIDKNICLREFDVNLLAWGRCFSSYIPPEDHHAQFAGCVGIQDHWLFEETIKGG